MNKSWCLKSVLVKIKDTKNSFVLKVQTFQALLDIRTKSLIFTHISSQNGRDQGGPQNDQLGKGTLEMTYFRLRKVKIGLNRNNRGYCKVGIRVFGKHAFGKKM